jgi:hypothetical protein
MTETNDPGPADLRGTVDERIAQLLSLEASTEQLTADWLRRQLRSALAAWAKDETKIDVEMETRTDY